MSLSPSAVLAAYIALWLMRCVVPSLSWKHVPIKVLYPVVQLVNGCPLGLLPAMVYRIQYGLRLLLEVFLNELNPNPCIDLPYTYLMSWFC